MNIITETNESDLLAVLLAALAEQDEAEERDTITSRELAERVGCSQNTAARRLRLLMQRGVVRPERVTRTNEWDVQTTVMGYRLVTGNDNNP